jgi:hypothetical protein
MEDSNTTTNGSGPLSCDTLTPPQSNSSKRLFAIVDSQFSRLHKRQSIFLCQNCYEVWRAKFKQQNAQKPMAGPFSCGTLSSPSHSLKRHTSYMKCMQGKNSNNCAQFPFVKLSLSFLLSVNFYAVEFDHGTPLAMQIANQLQKLQERFNLVISRGVLHYHVGTKPCVGVVIKHLQIF